MSPSLALQPEPSSFSGSSGKRWSSAFAGTAAWALCAESAGAVAVARRMTRNAGNSIFLTFSSHVKQSRPSLLRNLRTALSLSSATQMNSPNNIIQLSPLQMLKYLHERSEDHQGRQEGHAGCGVHLGRQAPGRSRKGPFRTVFPSARASCEKRSEE